MFNMLETNCPNCGGELTKEGNCNYCKTKVRYENVLNLSGDFDNEKVEILLKRTASNGDVYYLPISGYVTQIELSNEPMFSYCCYGNTIKYARINDSMKIKLSIEGTTAKYVKQEKMS